MLEGIQEENGFKALGSHLLDRLWSHKSWHGGVMAWGGRAGREGEGDSGCCPWHML